MSTSSKGSLFGGFAAITLSLSCCIGPAVFIITGATVGALGRLSFFAPYKIYFLIAAGGFLAYAIFRYYIRPQACSCSADRRKRRMGQLLTIFGGVLFLISMFFGQIVRLFA
jgi:hypothetical protein